MRRVSYRTGMLKFSLWRPSLPCFFCRCSHPMRALRILDGTSACAYRSCSLTTRPASSVGKCKQSGAGQPGAAHTETEAVDRRHALPAVTPVKQAYEQNHHGCPETGRFAGYRHMGPKTVSAPPHFMSLGRGDWSVSTVLPAILSGSSGVSGDGRGRRMRRPLHR